MDFVFAMSAILSTGLGISFQSLRHAATHLV
jgi:hypothetical protein